MLLLYNACQIAGIVKAEQAQRELRGFAATDVTQKSGSLQQEQQQQQQEPQQEEKKHTMQ